MSGVTDYVTSEIGHGRAYVTQKGKRNGRREPVKPIYVSTVSVCRHKIQD